MFNCYPEEKDKDLLTPTGLKQDGLLASLWDTCQPPWEGAEARKNGSKHLGFCVSRGWMVTAPEDDKSAGAHQPFSESAAWENEIKSREALSVYFPLLTILKTNWQACLKGSHRTWPHHPD